MSAKYKKQKVIFESKPNMNASAEQHREKNPRENANICSIITFAWFVPTFIKGFRKELDEGDLYEPLAEHKSNYLGDKLEEAWRKEKTKTKPSLRRALLRVFGFKLLLLGIVTILIELVFKIGQTLALRKLIYFYTPEQTEISKTEAYLYAGIIVMCSALVVFFSHNYVMSLLHIGMKVRVGCCSLVYRKSLKLSVSALGTTPTGRLINLLSNDVQRLDIALINIHNLWIAPTQLFLILYLVYMEVGWTGIIGVIFILLFIPLQIYLGKRASFYRMRIATRTDERVRLMNEIISGIQVIKMYTWEKPFAKLVAKARRLEIKEIKYALYVKGIILSITNFLSSMALFLSILTYVLLGNVVRAEYVFVISSFYNILRQSMTVYFPNGISQVAEALVSIQRLQDFLMREEASQEAETIQQNGVTSTVQKPPQVGVVLSSVTAKWTETFPDNTLDDVSLACNRGELVAVIGFVGSGKSSLLNVILKELPLLTGSVKVTGTISYASQDSWLFQGNIRENILFGQEYNEERYRTVIRVCALERDFSLFPYGDRSMVGEKGLALSGGQRARINLARAVYRDADIYLLDDPLAAVDTYVAKHLFEQCISGFLRDKCVILVTNQLHFLRSVNRIVLLKEGRVVAQGNYQELQESGEDFARLLEEELEDTESFEKLSRKSSWLKQEEQEGSPLQNKESISSGHIGRRIYCAYLKAGGNSFVCELLFLTFILAQFSASGSDFFLSRWTNWEQRRSESNNTEEASENSPLMNRKGLIFVYASIIAFCIIIFLTRSFAFFSFCMHSSTNLHNLMFSKVVAAPMRFFTLNPSGRILNRFSKDMGSVDETLPYVVMDTIQIGLKVIGITVVVATVTPWLLLVSAVILSIFYLLRIFYLATSRTVKRLEGVTRSPVFTHMNASLHGLTTIRAFGAQNMLRKQFDVHQDLHSSAWFMFLGSSRTFGFWLDLICVVYIACVTLNFLVLNQETYGGNVGLAITQSLMLTGMFQWGMRQWSELENQMTSVERIVEYTELDSERLESKEGEKLPPPQWPKEGSIQFKNVFLRYALSEPYILKNLNFIVRPQEKIGIVGRTGAGKSSLITALFQLVNTEGHIIIDGLDITKFPLQYVRSKISIIPQEPVLFSGSMRKNLDPFEEHTDAELWNALEEVELKSLISNIPSMLETNVSEGGTNFSVGQRQLLCLARAIIRRNKILVLDEATANVDPQTDALIQKTIRRKFESCTVLTVAHRLHTIIDSDKVLVMDNGSIVEFDHPYVLLNQKGAFYGMVQQTGKHVYDSFMQVTKENYESQSGKKDE